MSSGKKRTYEIRKATENDRKEILNALRRFYFHQVPSVVYFNGVAADNTVWKEFENNTMKSMDNPSWNFVAVNDGRIIGVCFNKEVTKDHYFDQSKGTDEAYMKHAKFWSDVRRQTDLFGKFTDIEKALMISEIGVDDEYRGFGIGMALVSNARDMAMERGYKLITACCASFYASQLFQRIGFEVIHKLKYDSYKINEKETIKSTPPHEYVEIVVQRI